MAYNIYTAEEHGGLLNHIAFFVRPASAFPEASGKCFHVTGSILAAMAFEVCDHESPLVASDHMPDSMVLIGTGNENDMARFEDVCRAVPPPEPQLKLNGKAKDPSKTLRCQDWVKEVVEKLKVEGMLLATEGEGGGSENDAISGD